MRINEIYDRDDVFWRTISATGNSFYVDFEDLRKRYIQLSSNYDKSTSMQSVKNRIEDFNNMIEEIQKMIKFCKNSYDDTETEEFLKSLKLMYGSCKTMIEDLEKFL